MAVGGVGKSANLARVVKAGGGGFDCVLGNPPFVNAIEGSLDSRVQRYFGQSSASVTGTADLAYRFVELADRIAVACGAVGLVQPKAFLNSGSVVRLRADLMEKRSPTMLYIPKTGNQFSHVATYVCLITLRRSGDCLVADEPEPYGGAWRRGVVADGNWWRAAQTILGNVAARVDCARLLLSEHFDVCASMTTGEAYEVKRFVKNDEVAANYRLVTTGLIDPGVCSWGQLRCRYLGDDFLFPAVAMHDALTASLKKRLAQSRRPKVLVAGLSIRVEAVLDPTGELLGAVSTFSIFHRLDDVGLLSRLCNWLNSDECTSELRAQLGAAAVGGGYMTIKKDAIKGLQVPAEVFHQEEGA